MHAQRSIAMYDAALTQVHSHCQDAIRLLWSSGQRPDIALALLDVQAMLTIQQPDEHDPWNQALTQLMREGA